MISKTWLVIAASFLSFQSARGAASPLPFYEPFPTTYTPFTVIGTLTSAATWNTGNTGSTGGARIDDIGGGLTFPGLLNPGYSYSLDIFGTPGSSRNKGVLLTDQTLSSSNRVLYASFLLYVYQPPTNSRLFAALSSLGVGTTTPPACAGVWLDPSGPLALSKNSNTNTVATNNINVLDFNSHLVVVRYKWKPSTNDDEVALWVDPQALGVDEGSVPVPPASATNGVDATDIQSFFIIHTTSASLVAGLYLDEIRVATNWAGVTPTITGAPIPSSRPVINKVLRNGNGLIVRGTNGFPNSAYQVLTANHFPALPYEWSVVATRLFDASGNFDFTNVYSPEGSSQFVRLLVGGEVPPAPVAPYIINQPTNLTVLVGQTAAFYVTAAGDPTLSYQWIKNNNAPQPGATNASFILANPQLSDAGGYSVVVTNTAGSVTSVVATLTVNAASSGPSIIDQPQSLVVTQGQTAFFSVNANGNPPPVYQWYYNANTPLLDATNSSLTLSNVQSSDAGFYSVSVANTNGAVASSNALLTVLSPPAITNQPSSQIIVLGQSAFLSVAATGTAPLLYEWYYNTNTLISNATNSTLSTTNAGNYSVLIANSIGSVTSAVVSLTVLLPPTNSAPIGFATVNGTTTGGTGGPVVTVNNAFDFASQISMPGPRVIQVQGSITYFAAFVANDKTIVGLGTNASLIGDLLIDQTTNVIVQNLTISNPNTGDDGITISGNSEHIWIDHCTFVDCADGEIDVVTGSDYVTISWCKFYYTANTGHNFVNLIGNSENLGPVDTGRLHVTFHHNWWSTLCFERMPRVRFGRVHVFNNYLNCTGNSYCVRAGYLSEILVENNYYDQINRPYEYFVETPSGGSPAAGLIKAVGDATPNCTNVGVFSDPVFTPTYGYTLESPDVAKAYVLFGAGAGTPLFP